MPGRDKSVYGYIKAPQMSRTAWIRSKFLASMSMNILGATPKTAIAYKLIVLIFIKSHMSGATYGIRTNRSIITMISVSYNISNSPFLPEFIPCFLPFIRSRHSVGILNACSSNIEISDGRQRAQFSIETIS